MPSRSCRSPSRTDWQLWAPDVMSPHEGLPSREQFSAGSGLDNARKARRADGPEVCVSKDKGPAGLGKVRMGQLGGRSRQ